MHLRQERAVPVDIHGRYVGGLEVIEPRLGAGEAVLQLGRSILQAHNRVQVGLPLG